jgi:hypothetical protein
MNILKATYGDVDVAEKVKSKINNGKIFLFANNSFFGDTKPGVLKYLETEIELDGLIFSNKTRENELFVFPETKSERLGIFYSNNNEDKIKPCILASLRSIEKAAKGKADIVTNMWNSYSENPFFETIAWTRTSSHLNQVLQILQCLYVAQQIHNYKYVSFLEHDVLYAEGYFDYEDFDHDVICNMNYMGMNNKGFQSLSQRDKPTSQLTMKFDYAIQHFSNLIPNALIRNSGLSEPQTKIVEWQAKNSNVHVNHGRHFTSHYNVYSKTDIKHFDDYWGDYQQYLSLFI